MIPLAFARAPQTPPPFSSFPTSIGVKGEKGEREVAAQSFFTARICGHDLRSMEHLLFFFLGLGAFRGMGNGSTEGQSSIEIKFQNSSSRFAYAFW
jgi:hypothetical protein